MANPTWFDYTYYMNAKLAQVQAAEPDKKWTLDTLKEAFEAAGFKGEEGAYDHYDLYGDSELVSPSAMLNVAEYYAAKLLQLQKAEPEKNWTQKMMLDAFKDAGLTAGEHYDLYGAKEGVNPSNAFDEVKYMADKLLQLQKAEPEKNWTAETMQQAFDEAGLTPLEHYLQYGKDEGLSATPVANPVDPIHLANPGTTFTLTTGVDTVNGTAKDDIVNGVASSLSSEGTLNAGDKIDGAAGLDTLNVAMKGNFSGFSGDGFMKNVEVVNLTSDSTIARTFDSTGATGITEYNIDAAKAAVNLSNVADLASTISVKSQASGAFTVAYAKDVTAGAADTQALRFEAMGKLDDAATAANEESAVTATVAGVETLKVKVAGDNVIKFAATDAKTVALSGAGTLKGDFAASTAVQTVDASAATGALNLTLGASGAKTVALGSGDDTLNVGAGALAINATVDGGAGKDTLVLGNVGTAEYVMSNVETVKLVNSTAVTYSAKNTAGIESIVVSKDAAAQADFVNMGSVDEAITLQGANANNVVAVSSDHKGVTTLNVSGPAKDATAAVPTVNKFGVTVDSSSALNMTVDAKMDYMGNVSAAKANSVELAVNGAMHSVISAAAAKSVVITSVAQASTLNLQAAKATDLTVTAAKGLALQNSTLSSLESLTANTAGYLDMTGVALGKAAKVSLEGTGQVKLGNLGGNTQDYALSLVATGLSNATTPAVDALTVGTMTTLNQAITVDTKGVLGDSAFGAIDAGKGSVSLALGGKGVTLDAISGKAVTLDASGVLGDMTYNAPISAADSVNFTAALTGNTAPANFAATGATFTGAFNGSAKADALSLTISTAKDIKLTMDLGAGNDTFAIDNSGVSAVSKVTGTLDGGANDNTLTVKGNVDFSKATVSNFTFKTDASSTTTLVATAAADTIEAGAGGATITGGAGADIIKLAGGTDILKYVALTDSTATAYDKVSNFTVGTDKIDVATIASGATVATDDGVTSGKLTITATTLAAAIAEADAAVETLNTAVFFALDDNEYFFMQGGTTDLVVELTGTTAGATMTAAAGVFSLATA